jgi:hypothetical protein
MINLKTLARALGGEISGGQVLAPGPGHTAADRSLCVKLDDEAPDGFVVHSFSTDDPIVCRDHVRKKVGLPAFKANGRRNGHGHASPATKAKVKPRKKTWIYENADGSPYLGVERIDLPDGKKKYLQWNWNGSGFESGKPKGAKIPYRLPELVKAPGQPVFICEGEKCADAVAKLGWLATTSSEGAGKWTPDLNEWFADRVVYILPDNDAPGLRHADLVASNLVGVAREVRIIKLEGLGDGEDVFDWIARAEFPENLLRITEDAPLWKNKQYRRWRRVIPNVCARWTCANFLRFRLRSARWLSILLFRKRVWRCCTRLAASARLMLRSELVLPPLRPPNF